MTSFEAQARAALSAAAPRPPRAFLWFGRRESLPRGETQLSALIARRLEADFLWAGAPRPRADTRTAPAAGGGRDFVRALSQANCGRGSWQPGWRVVAGGAGADEPILVERPGGLRLLAPPADCRSGTGPHAEIRVPKELLGLSPGLYVARGDAPLSAGRCVRLYWRVAAAGAVTLVARVTYALNGAGLPFRLELAADPARYGAYAPAPALVVARADFATAMKLLRPLLRALGPQLGGGAPAFAKPLARGLAVAEDPRDAGSFCEHRCALLATAIVAAHGTKEPLAVVRETFATAGIALDAPHLEPGSDDAYAAS